MDVLSRCCAGEWQFSGVPGRTRLRAVLLATSGLALLLAPSGAPPAHAACTSFAPASGQSVTCDNTSTQGVLADSSTNVSLTVLPSGSIVPASGYSIALGDGAIVTLGAGSTIGSLLVPSTHAIYIGDGSTVTLEGAVYGVGGITGRIGVTGLAGFANSTITLKQGATIEVNGAFSNYFALNGRNGGNTYQIDGSILATGTFVQGIGLGAGDTVTIGATGSVETQGSASTPALSGSLRDNITVNVVQGGTITTHGLGGTIELGNSANVTVAGTLYAVGDKAATNSSTGRGIRAGNDSKVWLTSTGKIYTGNALPGVNNGSSGEGILAGQNAKVTVDGLIDTRGSFSNGVRTSIGSEITVGATGRVTTHGNAYGILISANSSPAINGITINIGGTVESLGTQGALFINAANAPGSIDVPVIANVTIAQGGTLHAAQKEAYSQFDGAGNFPEVIDNLVIAGTVSRGNAGRVINLNDGADTLTLFPTAVIIGSIDGGSDAGGLPETDTFIFTGAGATSGTFNFNVNAVSNFEAARKTGAGDWTLHGNAGSGISGTFKVEAGRLFVDGIMTTPALEVKSGASLGGTGSVGATTVADGGILLGKYGQTLSLTSLTLNANSRVNVTLDAPSSAALFMVTGNLTVDGRLAVTNAGNFGEGVYRIFDYGGTLTDNGLSVDPLPGFLNGAIQTAVDKQVNLVVSQGTAPAIQFWNGATTSANGQVNGGSGTWTADWGHTNWTDANGTVAQPWGGKFAVFQGTPGIVTVDDTAGAVSTTGMQFAVDGYRVEGAALTLAGSGGSTLIRVGDGTAAGDSYTATIASALTGSGGLRKSDLGTLVLNGISDYQGPTTVEAGSLMVFGSIVSQVNVENGALLGGAGTVGGITALAGSTVAPSSLGTPLSVTGNTSFADGSVYRVMVNPQGQATRIVGTGTATIDGGMVEVLAASGNYAASTSYTILTADGGIVRGGPTDGFSGVMTDLAFLTPKLQYDPNNVYLTLTRNGLSFASIGGTRNQRATGAGVEPLGPGAPVYDAVVQLDAAGARAAFDLLSGEIHASAKDVMLEDSRFVRHAAIDRLRAAFGSIGGSAAPVATYDRSGEPQAVAATTNRFAFWGEGFGSWGRTQGDGNATALDRDIGGLFVGGDGRIGEIWRVGLLGGYSHTSFDAGARRSSGESENYHVGLYGGTAWDALALRAGAAYAWHDLSTRRAVAFPGFTDWLKADYGAETAQVFGEIGYDVRSGRLGVEPFANLAYVNLLTDAFTERGGVAALASRSSNSDVTFTTLGLRVAADVAFDGLAATAKATVGWRHAYGDVTPLSTFAFAGSDAFTIAGVPIAQDAAVIEAGLDVALAPGATLGLSYSGQYGNGIADQGGRASLNVRF